MNNTFIAVLTTISLVVAPFCSMLSLFWASKMPRWSLTAGMWIGWLGAWWMVFSVIGYLVLFFRLKQVSTESLQTLIGLALAFAVAGIIDMLGARRYSRFRQRLV